jgi:hypothetical protein
MAGGINNLSGFLVESSVETLATVMSESVPQHPYGWNSLDPESVSYEFGEARYGKSVNDIPANEIGNGGEDDKHSAYVDPDGSFGAAKVAEGLGNYGNTDDYSPEGGSADPGDTGTLDLPHGHMVIENGVASGRNYYLVQDIDTKKFYTVVPNFKEGKQYKSPMHGDRVRALSDAYNVLSATLPDSALAQLRQRFPETPALENV